MTTIADELFHDFEDSGSEGENDQSEQNDGLDSTDFALQNGGTAAIAEVAEQAEQDGDEEELDDADDGDEPPSNVSMDVAEDEEETKARVEKMELGGVSDVRSVAPLMKDLKPILEKVNHYKNLPPEQQTKNIGNIEDNPEYQLLTQANQISTRIDGDIFVVHKWIRDHYSTRFPELETMVQNPVEYAKSVAIIGNGPMDNIRAVSESKDNIVGQSLKQVLDGPSLMTVAVEATQTRGEAMSDQEVQRIRDGCDMLLKLDNAKKILRDYVQSRMFIFAPNLTTLIGSLTAAQLIGHTGGISGLGRTPACNLAPLGSNNKRATVGLATNIGVRQQGFLFNNDIIRGVPQDIKVKAMRILAAKIVLAARIDQMHQSPAGEQGLAFYDQVEKRINKLSEAPPNSRNRALPAPDEKPSRKRGGRRARNAKAATAMTDLRKAQNRMAFGKEEIEVGYGDSTKGLGMIGAQDAGRVRATQIDQRTRAKLSKKNPGWGGATPASSGTATSLRGFGAGTDTVAGLKATGLRASGVGSGIKTQIGNVGGTASTIAFTPVQGLELVNPQVRADMERKRKAEEDRYFKSGTFTQIGGTTTSTKLDAQGFKVPALPMKKAKPS
ncbi:hypothetical protein AMS68_007578 [Peltaster fructicola]|uniref:Nop domain-containing protein n=1 Tax=Peltaster fructicola TaxID=286661 RepID=A0A6H0Y564_9PEZI|nr:hypothetical protein AMS68_007578 [Peltaster fructicola]